MCEKKPYCNSKIDECIQEEIEYINRRFSKIEKTIASCCGHGRYHKTIIIRHKVTKQVYDHVTGVSLPSHYKNGRYNKRFYISDKDGYYYIPKVEEHYKQLESKINNV